MALQTCVTARGPSSIICLVQYLFCPVINTSLDSFFRNFPLNYLVIGNWGLLQEKVQTNILNKSNLLSLFFRHQDMTDGGGEYVKVSLYFCVTLKYILLSF